MQSMDLAIRVSNVVVVAVLIATLGGCVLPTQDPSTVLLAQEIEQSTPAGVYWIDIDDSQLEARPIDNVREVSTFLVQEPAEYTGPGWYELTEDGAWIARPDLDDLSIDELAQVQNPAR
jgi:hypothetical protein